MWEESDFVSGISVAGGMDVVSDMSFMFNTLGILPANPAHLSEFPSKETGTHIYTEDYHFVGRVLEGELCTDSIFNEMNTIQIENFT